MRSYTTTTLALLTMVLATAGAQADLLVTFEQIPDAASANDMSPDGRYVVGESDRDGNGFADGTYIWDTVLDTVTFLPPEGLTAVGISDDGTVVVGEMPDPNDPDPVMGVVAARWTEATGWQSIGYLPNALECPSRSDGYEVSADGSVVVGLSWDGCSGRGFVWTEATGMQELEPLANGNNRASVLSADGTLIGGFAQGSSTRTPAIWDGVTTNGDLMDPPNGDALGEIFGISDDGSVMLGTWWLNDPNVFVAQAVKWTSGPSGWERTLIDDGSWLPGWEGVPMDIADNGTIVGFDFLVGNRNAWIQPLGTGPIVDMVSFIESHGGNVPAGEALQVCQAISTDGRTIIGHSWPMTGGWIVRINCEGDLDGDFDVDLADLAQLLANYGTSNGATYSDGDLDGDGDVDLADLAAMLSVYGSSC